MAEQSAQAIQYDDKNYRALMDEYKTLSTYENVAGWDQRAQAEVDKLAGVLQELEAEIARQSETLEQTKREHAQKSFLKRTFSDRKPEKEIAQFIDQCRQNMTTLEGMASKLQEAIDFTPNSPEEQKTLLKELRLRKKELQAEKREVAANMKAIRNEARAQSVHAGRGFFGYSSKSAAYDRRQIRYAKEAALGPHEDAKTAIERQLIQVEKDIVWAERFNK